MAQTLKSDEERLRRIELIKLYVLEKIEKNEPFSTRGIAKYFTENKIFNISNNTVDNYLKALQKIDLKSYEVIDEKLSSNKPKTIDDDEVVERIRKVVELILKDYTVVQIAEILNVSQNTIIRDINNRLDKLDFSKETLEQVKNKLSEHSLRNLKNQGISSKK